MTRQDGCAPQAFCLAFPGMAIRGSPAGPRGRPEEVSWPVVLGLGSLALLLPLADLTGLRAVLGPAPSALLLFGVVTATWIGVVGLGRVPRPVLTLTLAGCVFGVVLVILSVALRTLPDVDGHLLVIGAAFEIARSTGLGALAGLIATALQTRSRR
jgi:hypothetical protein